MSGGGHIIIENAVRQTASMSVVQSNISHAMAAGLDAMLAEPVGSWDQECIDFAQRCIALAFKNSPN